MVRYVPDARQFCCEAPALFSGSGGQNISSVALANQLPDRVGVTLTYEMKSDGRGRDLEKSDIKTDQNAFQLDTKKPERQIWLIRYILTFTMLCFGPIAFYCFIY
jgi:hypothetical protein